MPGRSSKKACAMAQKSCGVISSSAWPRGRQQSNHRVLAHEKPIRACTGHDLPAAPVGDRPPAPSPRQPVKTTRVLTNGWPCRRQAKSTRPREWSRPTRSHSPRPYPSGPRPGLRRRLLYSGSLERNRLCSIPQRVQVVGPGLHHGATLGHELGPVVGHAQGP